jgi:hypothetical protein
MADARRRQDEYNAINAARIVDEARRREAEASAREEAERAMQARTREVVAEQEERAKRAREVLAMKERREREHEEEAARTQHARDELDRSRAEGAERVRAAEAARVAAERWTNTGAPGWSGWHNYSWRPHDTSSSCNSYCMHILNRSIHMFDGLMTSARCVAMALVRLSWLGGLCSCLAGATVGDNILTGVPLHQCSVLFLNTNIVNKVGDNILTGVPQCSVRFLKTGSGKKAGDNIQSGVPQSYVRVLNTTIVNKVGDNILTGVPQCSVRFLKTGSGKKAGDNIQSGVPQSYVRVLNTTIVNKVGDNILTGVPQCSVRFLNTTIGTMVGDNILTGVPQCMIEQTDQNYQASGGLLQAKTGGGGIKMDRQLATATAQENWNQKCTRAAEVASEQAFGFSGAARATQFPWSSSAPKTSNDRLHLQEKIAKQACRWLRTEADPSPTWCTYAGEDVLRRCQDEWTWPGLTPTICKRWSPDGTYGTEGAESSTRSLEVCGDDPRIVSRDILQKHSSIDIGTRCNRQGAEHGRQHHPLDLERSGWGDSLEKKVRSGPCGATREEATEVPGAAAGRRTITTSTIRKPVKPKLEVNLQDHEESSFMQQQQPSQPRTPSYGPTRPGNVVCSECRAIGIGSRLIAGGGHCPWCLQRMCGAPDSGHAYMLGQAFAAGTDQVGEGCWQEHRVRCEHRPQIRFANLQWTPESNDAMTTSGSSAFSTVTPPGPHPPGPNRSYQILRGSLMDSMHQPGPPSYGPTRPGLGRSSPYQGASSSSSSSDHVSLYSSASERPIVNNLVNDS